MYAAIAIDKANSRIGMIMENSKKLMVIIDPTVLRDHVVERAKLLALSLDASVELFINCHGLDGRKVYFSLELNKADAAHDGKHDKALLQALEAEFSEIGVATDTHLCEEKDVAQSIIDRADALGPDIVLKSTHRHSVLKQTLLTSTDWQLIQRCSAPLMLVKPQAWYSGGNIVAAVDPLHSKSEQSKLDDALVSAAESLAQQTEQIPGVFHAYYPPNLSDVKRPETKLNRDMQKLHNQKIYELLSRHNIDPDHVRIAKGDVKHELLEHLKNIHPNVLVIGALSRNRLERYVVGNTAEQILDSAPCDILVLKAGNN